MMEFLAEMQGRSVSKRNLWNVKALLQLPNKESDNKYVNLLSLAEIKSGCFVVEGLKVGAKNQTFAVSKWWTQTLRGFLAKSCKINLFPQDLWGRNFQATTFETVKFQDVWRGVKGNTCQDLLFLVESLENVHTNEWDICNHTCCWTKHI